MGKKRSEKKKKKSVKVVFDTNIWIALALNKHLTQSFGPILDDAIHYEILMSNQMVSELGRVLTYPKIAHILKESNVDPRNALATILRRVKIRTVLEGTIGEIKGDDSDNRILECALDSNASYIVSGDSHLLKLKEFKRIKIVSASEFLDQNFT